MKRRNYLKLNGTILFSSFFSCIKRPPDAGSKQTTGILTKVKRAMLTMQRASWEQGVAAQAFLESGDTEIVYLMAKEAVLRQTAEGRLSVVYTDNGVTDPAASGEAVLYAANKWGDDDLKKGAEKMLAYLLEKAPRTSSGVISHTLDTRQIWIDSMYMAPPFIAVSGKYDEAIKQINGIHETLWNPAKKLYSHQWSDDQKEFIIEKCWGVGNGWAIAGMSRVLKALPVSMVNEKELLIHRIKTTIDSCLLYIRPDHLFFNIIDDPSSFIETNLSQMIAYTIFRGISENWLEAEKYLDAARRMRDAAIRKVDASGFVQGVCGAPFFNRPGRATEGQAFFILMEAAFRKGNF